MIAALFVDPAGIYSKLSVDCWGIDRDARLYTGPGPVIAHPPCQLWGKMANVNYARYGHVPGADGGCFKSALANVRRCGGVLEHPAQSYAWAAFNLVKPMYPKWNKCNGYWVCEIWQSAYDHLARKRTWLLYVGSSPTALRWKRVPGKCQVGSYKRPGGDDSKIVIRGKLASATPIAFALDLITLVQSC